MQNAALSMTVTTPSADGLTDLDPEIEIIEELDESDLVECADDLQDSINLAAEAELIADWVEAYIAGDPVAAVYEDWLAQLPTSHPGRFPVTLAA